MSDQLNRQEMISIGEEGLSFEGHSIVRLADRLGTPFFLFSESQLARNCVALKRGLSIDDVDPILRYCVKTNNEPEILEGLAGAGLGAVVSHPAEGELARAAGFCPEVTAFQRPVLLPEDVNAVLDLGIDLIHVYQPSDVALLEEAAKTHGRRVRVSLRLAGLASRFSLLGFMSRRLGLSHEDAFATARRVADSTRLQLRGINFYVGTQQRSPSGFARALDSAMALARRISSELGIAVEEVNIGGGIPSTSLHRATALDLLFGRDANSTGRVAPQKALRSRLCERGPEALEAFCRRLAKLFVCAGRRAGPAETPRLAAEPGRSIVGNAGALITRVRAVKGDWAFLDASRNYLAESPVLLQRAITRASGPMDKATRRYHLSGATLNTTDVIDLRRRLPALSVGDVLVFWDAGAYSLARASRYAGLTPAAYMVRQDGSVGLIRPADTVRDLSGARVLS